MIDYQKYINALRKCTKEHENDITSTGHVIVSDLCRDTANLLEALEKEPKMLMSSNIYLELTPFEAGVLTSILYKAVYEGADPVVNKIYIRLIELCNEKYYKD